MGEDRDTRCTPGGAAKRERNRERGSVSVRGGARGGMQTKESGSQMRRD